MKKVIVLLTMPLTLVAQEMGIGEFEREQIRQSQPATMKQSSDDVKSSVTDQKIDKKQQEALLFYWSAKGDVREIKKLLKKGVNPNIQDAQGNTPLHYAKDLPAVRALVNGGADVNVQNNDGVTRLHIDVVLGRVMFVNYLIRKGADVTLKTKDGATPLHLATMISYFENPKVAATVSGLSKTVIASASAVLAVILSASVIAVLTAAQVIMAVGTPLIAIPALLSSASMTVLASSAAIPAAAISSAILATASAIASIDIGVRNLIARNLIRAGANPNARDKDGNTPLHVLAMGKLLKAGDRRGGALMAQNLILNGAKRTIKNKQGQIPYDIAIEYQRPVVAYVLNPRPTREAFIIPPLEQQEKPRRRSIKHPKQPPRMPTVTPMPIEEEYEVQDIEEDVE